MWMVCCISGCETMFLPLSNGHGGQNKKQLAAFRCRNLFSSLSLIINIYSIRRFCLQPLLLHFRLDQHRSRCFLFRNFHFLGLWRRFFFQLVNTRLRLQCECSAVRVCLVKTIYRFEMKCGNCCDMTCQSTKKNKIFRYNYRPFLQRLRQVFNDLAGKNRMTRKLRLIFTLSLLTASFRMAW